MISNNRGFRGDGHADLRELRQDRREAISDGVVTRGEARELRHDRRQLEPGEHAMWRAHHQGDGHKDARTYRAELRAFSADGHVGPLERAALKDAFGNMEPRERGRALERLSDNGHYLLAAQLYRSVQ